MPVETTIIGPELAKLTMRENIGELWRYRGLIWTMIERDLRVRYKGSVLGILWSMIVPIAQAFLYAIVFGVVLGVGGGNLSAYIFCALIPWLFFQTSVLDASQSILGQLQLIKKVYFPREIPVIATACASLIHLLISLVVFVIYRWGVTTLKYGWPGPPPSAVVFLPVVLVSLFLLTLGLSFFVAAMNVFYEDIKFMVNIGMQFLMYLTPIMYFAEMLHYAARIPQAWRSAIYHVYLCDPIAWIVGAFKQMFFLPALVPVPGLKHPVLTASFDWRYCIINLATSTLICVLGYATFNKAKWRFTERP